MKSEKYIKIITKEDYRNLLIKKLNLNTSNYSRLDEILNEFYDLNIKTVIPFSELETYIIRERFGVLNNGIVVSNEQINNKTGIGLKKINEIIKNSFNRINYRIKFMNKEKMERLSSFDLFNQEDIYLINEKFSKNIKGRLLGNNILTLRDLLGYDIKDLKRIFSDIQITVLEDFVHSKNLLFISELTKEEKQEIIAKYGLEVLKKSSREWYRGLDSFDLKQIEDEQLKSKKQELENIRKIKKELENNINISLDELLELDIDFLNLSTGVEKYLRQNNINTIKDIVKLTKHELFLKLNLMKIYLNEVLEKIYGLGLVFKDEIDNLNNYSEAIIEELKTKK